MKIGEDAGKIRQEDPLSTLDARCFPFPVCPVQHRCARYHHQDAMSAMNASPYRTENGCNWFIPMVRDQA